MKSLFFHGAGFLHKQEVKIVIPDLINRINCPEKVYFQTHCLWDLP
jgi:hypothetical protein